MSTPGKVTVSLSLAALLPAFYASVIVLQSGLAALGPELTSQTGVRIAMLFVTAVAAFLGTLLGKSDAAGTVAALQAENAALKESGAISAAPVAPEPAPTVVGVTVHLSDGSAHELA